MEKKNFTKLLGQRTELNHTQVKELNAVLKEYPFFQAARALQLKGLYQNQSLSYDAELKKVAAYTTDRSVLFDFITSKEFQQHSVSKRIKKRQKTLRDSDQTKEWEDIIQMNEDQADQVLDPELFEKTEDSKIERIDSVEKDEAVKSEADLKKLAKEKPSSEKELPETKKEDPVKFDKNQQRSFSEWLKLTKVKPISREKEQSEEPQKTKSFREQEIVDRFIEGSPKIKPPKKSESHSSVEANELDKRLMTETLAKVYTAQKNYNKAIQAYKILILKNPEKSSLFADRIREIENSRENKNK